MKIRYFAINLEGNPQRRKHIENEAKNAGINLEIFKAITPDEINKIPHRYNAKRARCFTGRPLMNTEIACGLSHITLWRNLLKDSNADYYLILEDDAYIESDIKNLITLLNIPFVNFLRLSGWKKRPMKAIKKLSNKYTLYRYAYGPLNAGAYLISKKAAKPLAEYCQSLHTPIDILMDRSYEHRVPTYGILPYPVNTYAYGALGTDIGLRNLKYSKDIKIIEKLSVKRQRLSGSFKKRQATLKLFFQKQ